MASEYSKELYTTRNGAINFTRDTMFSIMRKYNEIEKNCGMEKDKMPTKIDLRNMNIIQFLEEVSDMLSFFANQVDSMKYYIKLNMEKK